MKKRNSFIDLWRFIGMMMIMGHHQYYLGLQSFPFYYGWVFVEFYFILTGYLTTNHFDREQSCCLEEMCKNAVSYTIHKFVPLLPFVWTAMLIEYGRQAAEKFSAGVSLVGLVEYLSNLPMELLLVSSSYTKPVLVPVWYLSAMFIVFPVFCLLLQAARKHLLVVLSFTIPIVYYGAFGVADNWTFPLNLGRAFSAMLLGTLAFELNQAVLPKVYRWVGKWSVAAIQVLCVVCPILACYNMGQYLLRPIMLAFFLGIAITMSETSGVINLNSKLMVYLGKISMPIYLFHWPVAGVIAGLPMELQQQQKVGLYYVASILVSVAAYEIHRCINNYIAKRNMAH